MALGPLVAHGIGSRSDLPLPLGWVIGGAAVAVVVSFLALGVLRPEPRLDGEHAGRPLPRPMALALDGPWTRRVLSAFGVLAAAWTLLALLFGKQDAHNPVPWVVFVLLWVGIVPASVIAGPLWRRLNPLRTVHAGLNRVLGLDPREGLWPLPAGVGWWPAALGLAAFTWLELIYPDSATIPVLRLAIALYAAVHWLAALLFGSRWFDHGDAFEAWSGLFGRLSPLGRRADGVLVVRLPLAGLDAVRPEPGLVATVAVMLGSTAFDGLSGSAAWGAFAQSQPLSRLTIGTLGLLTTIVTIAALFCACAIAAGWVAGLPGRRALAMPATFAHSLLPVALGYVVAHYYSLLVIEGQQAFVRLSDPLGNGGDWLGTRSLRPSAALVTPTIVADLQVSAIVIGHVLGVVLAHDRAVRVFSRRAAVLGQLPLLTLMVALTCFGLLLLFWS